MWRANTRTSTVPHIIFTRSFSCPPHFAFPPQKLVQCRECRAICRTCVALSVRLSVPLPPHYTLFLCRYAALCSDMLEGNISVCKGAAAISSVGERVMICDTCVIYCYIPRLLVRLVAWLPHYYLAIHFLNSLIHFLTFHFSFQSFLDKYYVIYRTKWLVQLNYFA